MGAWAKHGMGGWRSGRSDGTHGTSETTHPTSTEADVWKNRTGCSDESGRRRSKYTSSHGKNNPGSRRAVRPMPTSKDLVKFNGRNDAAGKDNATTPLDVSMQACEDLHDDPFHLGEWITIGEKVMEA